MKKVTCLLEVFWPSFFIENHDYDGAKEKDASQEKVVIGGPKFRLDYFVSDFNNDATASNIEQGISDLGSLLGD